MSPCFTNISYLFDRLSLTRRTLSHFHGEDIYVSSLFHGVGIFLFSFIFSMLLGIAFGLGCSLSLKHSNLASYPHIESCIVALVAYTSYFFSNGLSLSGESRLTTDTECRADSQGLSLSYSAVSRSNTTPITPCRSGHSGLQSICSRCWRNYQRTSSSSIWGLTYSPKTCRSSNPCSFWFPQ